MNNIEYFMNTFDNFCVKDYKDFEVALLLWIRSDVDILKDKNINKVINELKNILDNCDSILDIEKEDIDYIINNNLEKEGE